MPLCRCTVILNNDHRY
ncbi:Protein of unknown function [Pyronema omphalodes CBS 100304]|uniref:Uncharacterized protein n=1 Tax=Pyronema omphalodes (strain CBS 100304) TaxID=1076935 RepID=U4LLA5_PYROM|nr:Protein of unknown function [Pyronema omphalodes CBS 100304]